MRIGRKLGLGSPRTLESRLRTLRIVQGSRESDRQLLRHRIARHSPRLIDYRVKCIDIVLQDFNYRIWFFFCRKTLLFNWVLRRGKRVSAVDAEIVLARENFCYSYFWTFLFTLHTHLTFFSMAFSLHYSFFLLKWVFRKTSGE